MTRFQIFLLIIFGGMALLSILGVLFSQSRKTAGFTLVVSLCACAAAIWPNATTKIAQWVGIERGTDLILYCAVIAMMIGFFMFYVRLRHLRRELTQVVRHVAMLEANEQRASGTASPKGS